MPTPEPEEELDFSDLTDDQIVELAVALAREAMRRNPALAAAFEQSLLDERARVEAAARGTEQAKRAAAAELEAQAKRAEAARQKEQLRRRQQTILAEYLRRAALVIGKPAADITLVWNLSHFERGKGPKLQINQGATGTDTRWHLVDYVPATDQLYTSPGLHKKHADLLPWCRETVAAIHALNLRKSIAIKGIEL
ncbi:MAG TPA: hypothetical protein PKC42_04050 [Candidatus Nanoperiomorbaceae bacterium]|nr:hypothetical protein [Gammaproteobacteria bacterium]HMQ97243.1 hypothetical protein [Candidatus Nanoperiomorbaceae bacterium]